MADLLQFKLAILVGVVILGTLLEKWTRFVLGQHAVVVTVQRAENAVQESE